MVEQVPDAIKNVLDGHMLIALKGSEYFCLKKVKCETCNRWMRIDDEEEFFHAFVEANIVRTASRTVLSLPPEFVRPQAWVARQDCKWRAVSRWLEWVTPFCSKYNPVYLGVALYAKQEICTRII